MAVKDKPKQAQSQNQESLVKTKSCGPIVLMVLVLGIASAVLFFIRGMIIGLSEDENIDRTVHGQLDGIFFH